jgi:hypothetical protein
MMHMIFMSRATPERSLPALGLIFLKLRNVHLQTIDLFLQMIESCDEQIERVRRQLRRSAPRMARLCARKQAS